MLKNMKMGTKIVSLAVVLIILSAIVAGVGYNGLSGVVDRLEKADDVNRLINLMLSMRQHEKNFIIRGNKQDLAKVQKTVAEIKKHASETKHKFQDPANKLQMDDVLAAVDQYAKAFDSYAGNQAKLEVADDKMLEAARGLDKAANDIRQEQVAAFDELMNGDIDADADEIEDSVAKADDANRIVKWSLACRQQEKNFIMRGDKKYFDAVDKHVADIINLAKDLKLRFERVENKEQADRIIAFAQAYKAAFFEVVDLKEGQAQANSKMVATAIKTQEVCEISAANQKTKMKGQLDMANIVMLAGALIAIALGLFLSIFITRGITKPINRIIEGLNEVVDQVSSASGQVSSASQSLAEGASEQAASIEETSSSLEEMASMTKQNAENSQQADNLMAEANQVVGQANDSMGELITQMKGIFTASEETQKIIKTIDEVAFQTNLLALNAAVEAARAGEAGAGFAVVADEVRNLAMRAAEAAKNTAQLIEGTVKKVGDGSDIVNKTSADFKQVADSSGKVGELVGEIAVASNEQAQGIEQVNTAVAEMDKITQLNAANAEESASSSEEMNAQAEQMKGMVAELVALVSGGGRRGKVKGYKKAKEANRFSRSAGADNKTFSIPAKDAKGKEMAVHKAKEVSPGHVIPMDGEDFKDF